MSRCLVHCLCLTLWRTQAASGRVVIAAGQEAAGIGWSRSRMISLKRLDPGGQNGARQLGVFGDQLRVAQWVERAAQAEIPLSPDGAGRLWSRP